MAGLIVKGLESGREIGSTQYDIGSLWSRRSSDAAQTAVEAGKPSEFTPERNTPFVCLIAYPTDSLNHDQLLYDLAHYNFTGFMVRNFDITIERDAEITQFRIAGFNSFDEVHNYAQRIFNAATLAEKLRKTRIFLISQQNLELIGTVFSYDDYQSYYDKMFAPLEINPELPLDAGIAPIEQIYEDELPSSSSNDQENNNDSHHEEDVYEDDSTTGTEEEWYSE
jgi:hypothetical protein